MWGRLAFLSLVMMVGTLAHARLFPPIQEKTATTGIGVYREVDFPGSYLFTLTHAREYRIRTWSSIGAEANAYKFTEGNYSTVGISLRPVTKLYFYWGRHWQLFGETKGGIIFMIPQYQHRLINFTFTGAIGADWRMNQKVALRISGGYSHFSNGKRYSDIENAPWDGIGAELSITRTLH